MDLSLLQALEIKAPVLCCGLTYCLQVKPLTSCLSYRIVPFFSCSQLALLTCNMTNLPQSDHARENNGPSSGHTASVEISEMEPFTTLILCALKIEFEANVKMLDTTSSDPVPIDGGTYTIGYINNHRTILALCEGRPGPDSVTEFMHYLMSTFADVKYVFLVGVGGGCPEFDIRLGDVVVATEVVSLTESGAFIEKFDISEVIEATRKDTAVHLSEVIIDPSLIDDLYATDYPHAGPRRECNNCDRSKTIERSPRGPEIHHGRIASVPEVMRDAILRDTVSRRFNIKCFEMEAVAVVKNWKSTTVIRGIADYADSHKNDKWQKTAATHAALCATAVLQEILPPTAKDEVRKEMS